MVNCEYAETVKNKAKITKDIPFFITELFFTCGKQLIPITRDS
jgi:hypothetical protein